jgi:hypothetical protein
MLRMNTSNTAQLNHPSETFPAPICPSLSLFPSMNLKQGVEIYKTMAAINHIRNWA